MSLREQSYSVLVVSAAEKLNASLFGFLPSSHYHPIKTVSSISAGKRAWNERDYDFVMINSPLPDDMGIRFAIDLGSTKSTAVLLMIRSESYDEIRDKVIEHGVFTMPKPFSRSMIMLALDWMAATSRRLKKSEKKTLSIEEKMEEIRIVNRAKLLLISKLKMDEPQAHRYLEKQAMDRCIPKREVALEIIKTYG